MNQLTLNARVRNAVFLVPIILLMTATGCVCHYPGPMPTKLVWEKLPPIPDAEGFAGAFAGVSGGALVVAGGANIVGDKWGQSFEKKWYDSVFILDRPDGAWRTGLKLPHPLGYGVSITTSNGIICIGGSDSLKHYADVFRLEQANGGIKITSLPSLPKPCANFCGALLGTTIYVAGGIETPSAASALKTFWALDLAATDPHWVELEPWPGVGRMLAVAGVDNGSFYLISGTRLKPDANGKPMREYLHDAYAFTPGKGWRRLADLPQAVVAAPSPAALVDGRVTVYSGDDGSLATQPATPKHPGFSRKALSFDNRESWSGEDPLPFSRATAGTVEWCGHYVIVMGEVRPRERSPEMWWATLPPPVAPQGNK